MARARAKRATEEAWVELLLRQFEGAESLRSEGYRVELGIGDDAAVLARAGRAGDRSKLVWSVDTCVENVHFRSSWLSLSELGARAFHAAVSDLAAMGARPLAALSSLIFPRRFQATDLERLARGQARAARELGCPLVGGNLARGGELSVTTSVVGTAPEPLLRSGAKVGDEVWLLGDVGLARVGLVALSAHQDELSKPAQRRRLAACVARFKKPQARIEDGLSLRRRASAAIDLSDGLSKDARELGRASGVRIVLVRSRLEAALSPDLLRGSAALDLDPLEAALTGGDDYALLATGKASRRPRAARAIGCVTRGHGAYLDSDGVLSELGAGFDHIA